jgi:hypothetical protein
MKYFFYACLIIFICRLLASYSFCTFDDAFITYRYAQNLFYGHGLIYNMHEKVLGTTAPLFAILGVIPLAISVSVPKFFVVFNILCDLASFYLVWKYFFNRNQVLLVLFTILFSLDPTTSRIAVGGMEANLFLLGSLLGIVLYMNQKKLAAFLLLSGIYFLRPEALILFLIMLGYEWVDTRRIPWKWLLVSGLLIAGPLWWIHDTYGYWLSHSVVVKNKQPPGRFTEVISHVFFPRALNYFIFPLAVYGILKSIRRERYFAILALWMILYAAAYSVKGPWILNWYLYAIEVSQLLFAALAIREICSARKPDLFTRKWFLFSPAVAILVWVLAVQYLGRSKIELNIYQPLEADFRHMEFPERKVFFADDIGALGFYSHGYIYDDLELVTPQAAAFNNARERIVHLKPDYLFLYTGKENVSMIQEDSAIAPEYYFVKRYAGNGNTNLPQNNDLPDLSRYQQDYMLWKRKDHEK